MRNRLVASIVALMVGLIALYGIPRAFVLNDRVHANGQRLVDRSADLSAELVTAVQRGGDPVTAEIFGGTLGAGERIQVVTADGTTVTAPAGSSLGEDDLVAGRTLPGGGRLTYSLSSDTIASQVRDALLPLLLLGLALVPLGALAGTLLARRLSRPFTELAGAARELGTGRLTSELPDYDVPEADAIADALRSSSQQLDAMIKHERELAVNASHQLRTPITALRLALEDLSQWPQTQGEVAQELDRLVLEVDRLSTAVTDLLEVSGDERRRAYVDLDLADLVEASAARARDRLRATGHDLRVDADRPVPVRLPVAAVTELLDLLLESACASSPGEVRVHCADRGTHLAVELQQPLVPGGALQREATDIAESLGGRITRLTPDGTRVTLMLPRPAEVRRDEVRV